MILLKQVRAEEIYPIRHAVLRPGEPFEEAIVTEDGAESTLHFAAVLDGRAVTCISLFISRNPDFQERLQGQLRFLATYPEFRGKGYGSGLFRLAEFHAFIKNECELIWLNSRVPYIGFYERLGYTVHGNPFMLRGQLSHVVMKKPLSDYKPHCCNGRE